MLCQFESVDLNSLGPEINIMQRSSDNVPKGLPVFHLNEKVVSRAHAFQNQLKHLCVYTSVMIAVYFYSRWTFQYFIDKESSQMDLFFSYLSPMTFPPLIAAWAFYLSLYYFRPNRFEKYRANNVPWPWIQDPVG